MIKTFMASTDADYESKKNQVLERYDIAEARSEPAEGDPTVVFSVEEFGPLTLSPRDGEQWAPVGSRSKKGSTESLDLFGSKCCRRSG